MDGFEELIGQAMLAESDEARDLHMARWTVKGR